MNIRDRIFLFLDHKGYPIARLERDLGLSRSYFSKLKGDPGADKLAKLKEKFPELNMEWVIAGRGEMCLDGTTPKPVALEPELVHTFQLSPEGPTISYKKGSGQPYFDVDFIGGFDIVMSDQTITPEHYINIPGINDPDVVWVNVRGKSMEPHIRNGDIIALKPIEGWFDYLPLGEVYAIVTRNKFRTIKVVKRGQDENTFKLVPLNDEFDAEEIHKSSILAIFSVEGVARTTV
ncbi:MAG: helix-turn-helix transcriptional regulator [Fibrobacter sp.]|nr:helix-turn-helix transcriptional regulator [Fibrobacter sp.]